MKAFILAAGYAKRLRAVSSGVPKPLIEVAGAPILTHLHRRLLDLEDLSEIVIVGNHRYHAEFQRWAHQIEGPVPLRVLDDKTMSEADKLGAVGDIGFALGKVPVGNEDWLVVAGDNLLAFDLRPMQLKFRSIRHPLLLLRDVEHTGGPTPYNEVTIDSKGRVVQFREKPPDATTGLSAIALYFFTPQVVSFLQRYLAGDYQPDSPGHFIEWLVHQMEVGSERLSGRWFDIGSPETLAYARQNFRP